MSTLVRLKSNGWIILELAAQVISLAVSTMCLTFKPMRKFTSFIFTATGDMYGTLFKGVIVGFFFPFLPLFFFRAAEGEPPVFNKRMQMAIVAGLSINLLYGALRAMS